MCRDNHTGKALYLQYILYIYIYIYVYMCVCVCVCVCVYMCPKVSLRASYVAFICRLTDVCLFFLDNVSG